MQLIIKQQTGYKFECFGISRDFVHLEGNNG